MTIKKHTRHRSKAEILADIVSLHIHGGITEDRRKLASGGRAVCCNFQSKSRGRNICIRIPEEKLEVFKKAVGNGARADGLMAELSDANLSGPLPDVAPLKKLLGLVPRGSAKIRALMCRAADCIGENGIACTSRPEQTLSDEMNGLCGNLMSAMLPVAAEAAAGKVRGQALRRCPARI